VPNSQLILFLDCGSKAGNDPDYEQAAIALGKAFVNNNVELVYGGGSIG
jgi:predicted Rossmann-fold nucleotide-binding protein